MPASIFAAGFDPARVSWNVQALGPDFCMLQGRAAGHALLAHLGRYRQSVALLGPFIPDFTVHEAVRRIRANPETRLRSVMALLPDAPEWLPGVNRVLPLATDTATLEQWVAKLSAVPPRARLSACVHGFTTADRRPFVGRTENLSLGGMRVLSPDRLAIGAELDVWLELSPEVSVPVLARVLRADLGLGPEQRGYGVEFLYTPPASEEAITKVVGDDPPGH
jgi:hypothetical protein